jgi:hypothetical protein
VGTKPGLPEATLQTHRTSILRTLGLRGGTRPVAPAQERGLVVAGGR